MFPSGGKVSINKILIVGYIPYGIKIEQGGNTQTYFYVTDMRGTVIALTDIYGNIVETYSYDPFGNLLSNPTIYNPKLFIGRDDCLYDSETELYYMHARYYDPEAGRFIMKDQGHFSLYSCHRSVFKRNLRILTSNFK